MTTSTRRWRTPLPWLAGLLVVYLLSPLADFAVRLGTSPPPSPAGTGAALTVSLETATIATVVIAVVGVPLAYLLARGRSRRSTMVGIAVQLPIAMPPLVSGILLLYLVGPYTPVGRFFGGRLTDDRIGIVLAQIFVGAPFLVVAARSAFAALDPALEDVATTLGHGPWSRFVRAAVPAARHGIVAGLMLAWLRAFGEFGATVILAYHPYSLPVFTYLQFGSTGLTATMVPTAAALATAVAVLGVASLLGRTRGRASRPRVPSPRHTPPMRRPAPLRFAVAGQAGSFDLSVAGETNRCVAILGPSGAGKTLALRLLAGVHPGSEVSVWLAGTESSRLPTEQRRVGYLPQHSALFPHLDVWRQTVFARDCDERIAAYWLDRLGLVGLTDRLPYQLSGGQQRRVALARALASAPHLLLLDEPFTGLDVSSRDVLRRDLRRLLREQPVPTVLVTHDPQDAAMLADDIVLLCGGRMLRSGPIEEVYRQPGSVRAARLLGVPNAFEVEVLGPNTIRLGSRTIVATSNHVAGTRALVTISPWQIRPDHEQSIRAEVDDVIRHPDSHEIVARVDATTVLSVQMPLDATPPAPGESIGLAVPPEATRLTALDPVRVTA